MADGVAFPDPVGRVRVLEDLEAVSRAAAGEVVARAAEAVGARGRFTIALAGGHTPRRLYELLGSEYRGAVRWDRVHVFWGDERCVPPDDARSNVRLARQTLLEHVPVPAEAVHRVRCELDAEAAAAEYDRVLATFFGGASPAAEPPAPESPATPASAVAFDLALLGLGADGHTASLFPGQVEPDDDRWARAVLAPPDVEPRDRVTLTLRALNASARAVFLVSGGEKRAVFERVRRALDARGTGAAEAPPAAMVRPVGGVLWLVDRAAAGP